jgi:putative methylase
MESYEAMRLRKRDLELIIERIPGFRNPRRDLEQYQTPSWLAVEIAFIASLRGDIRGLASDNRASLAL